MIQHKHPELYFIWDQMGKSRNSYQKGLSFDDKNKAVLLDGSKWSELAFVEKAAFALLTLKSAVKAYKTAFDLMEFHFEIQVPCHQIRFRINDDWGSDDHGWIFWFEMREKSVLGCRGSRSQLYGFAHNRQCSHYCSFLRGLGIFQLL